jgi:uncharacterized membrane protein YhaH (DUF805 family)
MAEVRYTILFDGVTLGGMPEGTVKANLARLLQRDIAEIDAMFTGSAAVLKTGLSAPEADSFIQTLRQAGAIARKSRLAPETAKPARPVELTLEDAPPPRKADPVAQTGVDEVIDLRDTSADYRVAPRAASANAANSRRDNIRAPRPPREPRINSSDYIDQIPFFSLAGRLGRIRYLGWQFGATLLFILLAMGLAVLTALGAGKLTVGIFFLSALAYFVFNISVIVRRLHDLNWSGWWFVLWLVAMIGLGYFIGRDAYRAMLAANPAAYAEAVAAISNSTTAVILSLVNLVLGVFLCLKGGSVESNDYGEPPPPNGIIVTLLAGLAVFIYVGSALLGYKQKRALERQFLQGNEAAEEIYIPGEQKPDLYRTR